MTFAVVVDYETLEASANGTIMGQLHVVADGVPFPDRVWWDFPCVVLGWWVEALWDGQNSFELRFMDGPAEIDVAVLDNDVAALTAKIESATSANVIWTAAVPLGDLRAEVRRVAGSLVRECELRGLPTDGLERRLLAT